jgi:hypothetical protein
MRDEKQIFKSFLLQSQIENVLLHLNIFLLLDMDIDLCTRLSKSLVVVLFCSYDFWDRLAAVVFESWLKNMIPTFYHLA